MANESQPLSHKRPMKTDQFYFGAAYYPEHWDSEDRREDAQRMADAGFNLVRMAEFAWDLMEPEEGVFNFSFFDEVIRELGEKGINTMMCTPTATPPRWLTRKYPEVLRVDHNDHAMQHGSRQHCCHTNPHFREQSKRITRAMAEHFKDNPYVVGWQTDNEFNCGFSECHCPACQKGFADFLRVKFEGDIVALNRTWGTEFWAQSYASFDEILTPRIGKPVNPSPAHMTDYFRFVSHSVTVFQHQQVKILREIQPSWWVTHNGLFEHLDYRGPFTEDLDFLAFDCYPFFGRAFDFIPYWQSFMLDKARAYSGNFMIPEQQSGPGGQREHMHDTPEPGEIRRMNYTSLSRGCDSLLHFRWRTCRTGAEIYWCGILDHDNKLRRRYDEVKQMGQELKTVGPELLGTSVQIDAAVALGDQDVVDSEKAHAQGLPESQWIARPIHGRLFRNGYGVGCVHPSDDLSDLKLYVIPHWAMFNPDWVPNLQHYVEDGGTLVIGARTATRTMDNNIIKDTPPGCLAELAGVTVEEYSRRNNPEARVMTLAWGDVVINAEEWFESLEPAPGTDVVARWTTRHLAGQAAITCRTVGKGKVIYVGTYLTDTIFSALLPMLADMAELQPAWPDAPEGIEVTRRVDDRKMLWFFINHKENVLALDSTPEGTELLTGAPMGGPVQMQPHDVLIIKTPR